MKILRNKLFLGILCILIGLLIGFVLLPKVQSNKGNIRHTLAMKVPVQAGSQITADMVTTQALPEGAFPGALTNQSDAVGKYAASDLYAGDVLTAAKLTATPSDKVSFSAGIPAGKRVVSVTLPTLAAGISGRLRPGDTVMVMETPKYTSQSLGLDPDADTTEQPTTTETVPGLEELEVCMVTTADGADARVSAKPAEDEKNELPVTVSFYATPEQALKLAELEQDSIIHLALVKRGGSAWEFSSEDIAPIETEGK